ncbi:GNAT family N-acetyltransferase [Thalassomonas sp. M1454]|uniref:GNAT family N-acetyltransferase n=1 Tax=Thalassomonas sp. M1454 TaxID=2594477 RepID=UPI00117D208F|nr:GNAT family N-acetyltransferase [Thalassomonas sp. M1454]TRX58100.1 GNAT family N-acetyltransferase [Thalassomonas sp. M1454]
MISYRATDDLLKSAEITYDNMRSYYAHHSVDWEQAKILEQIQDLDNWDILLNGELIGVLRLSFDSDGCYLRDLQISASFQNRGIGAQALHESVRLARNLAATKLSLKVFKISPAYHLYKRQRFSVVSEDEKFYYMELKIT